MAGAHLPASSFETAGCAGLLRMRLLKKTHRIDVDRELHIAFRFGRARKPIAQIGREIESARRFHQQTKAMPPTHHRDRRLGRPENAHLFVLRRVRHQRTARKLSAVWRSLAEMTRLASRPNGG